MGLLSGLLLPGVVKLAGSIGFLNGLDGRLIDGRECNGSVFAGDGTSLCIPDPVTFASSVAERASFVRG